MITLLFECIMSKLCLCTESAVRVGGPAQRAVGPAGGGGRCDGSSGQCSEGGHSSTAGGHSGQMGVPPLHHRSAETQGWYFTARDLD